MDETDKVDKERVEILVDQVNSLPDVLDFREWLWIMEQLQQVAYGAFYDRFDPETKADSLRMNLFAMVSETIEMGDEVGWKPWSAPQGWVNREALISEAVDLMHFLANMLKHANATGEELTAAYKAKMLKNLQRQLDGYNVQTDKCPRCKRSFSEVDRLQHWTGEDGVHYCSKECADE